MLIIITLITSAIALAMAIHQHYELKELEELEHYLHKLEAEQ